MSGGALPMFWEWDAQAFVAVHCLCFGKGVFLLVPGQDHPLIPLFLPLQNGYINFEKRRKVRGVWGGAGWWVSLSVPGTGRGR